MSHSCILSSKDYPGCPGTVDNMLWTPDGCALVASWSKGGIAMWSTFGALLMCSLGWDYGLNIDIHRNNPLQILSMEFATEGYQLWLVNKNSKQPPIDEQDQKNTVLTVIPTTTQLIQLDFAKSALTINPCMVSRPDIMLPTL